MSQRPRGRPALLPPDQGVGLSVRWALIGTVSIGLGILAGVVSSVVLGAAVGPRADLIVGLPPGIAAGLATAGGLHRLIGK
ncbi:hypothetical protein Lfu02_72840 [Longispora fulva]|nr:hypothetical protein Lfu02_72840 [Longispora fulva]